MPGRKAISYPFAPRSTAHLLPGQFFSFRLSDGRYACGRVLSTAYPHAHGARTMFYCALIDWSGTAPATGEDIAGRGLLYEHWFHIILFGDYDARIDGHRPLELDGIVPAPHDRGVAGFGLLKIMAERHLAKPPS